MESSPVNILLVDDEIRNLDVLETCLRAPGYNLVRALSADSALLLLLNGEFAAIVLDVQMPGMTGLELAELIKQRKRTQYIPILFITAYSLEDRDILMGYGTGAVDYLTKPINPQILQSKIAVFVDLFRKNRALAEGNTALELEVAQRQRAEEALRLANNELEARVEARTADLLRAHDELSAREAQLRLVTDHAPVFITQFDRGHRFKFVNRTYALRFGLEPHEVVGRHFTEIMGEEPYRVVRPQLDAALAGQRVEFEAEIAYASLGPRWVFVVHEPERTASGEVVGLIAVVADITDRKLAEQALAAARDEAMAASRAKDDFLATLSHELRTPLNPVLLLATASAGNPALPAEVRADFETIAKNVMLEARLIDDLLDLTRIVRGKLPLTTRRLDLHTVVTDALAMTRDEIDEKGIVLELRLTAAHPIGQGDDVRLKQVFWNVFKNAAKFTPPKGRITIETSNPSGAGELLIRVSDTGIGMTPQELGRIFEAFSQGEHASRGTSHRFGGIGLGLAISRMMVELHDGSITAVSEGLNQGSTFFIRLPLLPHLEQPTSDGCAPQPIAEASTPTPSRFRLLLVEDHKPTIGALVQLLTRRGHDVTPATSVEEALAAAAEKSFDVAISDIGLPDGSGFDLMLQLRSRYGLTGIAMTGYGMEADVIRSQEAGFATHLTKPVSLQALDKALAEIAVTHLGAKPRTP